MNNVNKSLNKIMKCECGICKTCKNRIAVKKYRQNNPEKMKIQNEQMKKKF